MDVLTLKGTLSAGGQCGGPSIGCGASADVNVKTLALRCPGQPFQGAVETVSPIAIATVGPAGLNFVDLDLLGDLTQIEFLYLKSDQPIVLRVGADVAKLLGAGGIFPTGFVGGETLNLDFGGTAVAVVFLAGDQTAAQVAARINAACALAGLPTPRATVLSTGQLEIDGVTTGTSAEVSVTGGTGAAAIGYAGTPSASGAGADVPVYGTYLNEFGVAGQAAPPVPKRVQFSGVANLTIVAAGKTT